MMNLTNDIKIPRYDFNVLGKEFGLDPEQFVFHYVTRTCDLVGVRTQTAAEVISNQVKRFGRVATDGTPLGDIKFFDDGDTFMWEITC